jgi:putative ABC transport system substrate-binding protein
MRRREFIALLGSGVAAWPLAARAQQRDRVKRLGVLWGLAENDNVYQPYLSAFKQRLQDLGWIDGRNIRVEYLISRDLFSAAPLHFLSDLRDDVDARGFL